jgi:hypothetical protein
MMGNYHVRFGGELLTSKAPACYGVGRLTLLVKSVQTVRDLVLPYMHPSYAL